MTTDKGYIGVSADTGVRSVVTPIRASKNHPLTDQQKASNRLTGGCRVVVEHVMAQLSQSQVLRQMFRRVFGLHTRVFRMVAFLVDGRSAVTPLKTYPVPV